MSKNLQDTTRLPQSLQKAPQGHQEKKPLPGKPPTKPPIPAAQAAPQGPEKPLPESKPAEKPKPKLLKLSEEALKHKLKEGGRKGGIKSGKVRREEKARGEVQDLLQEKAKLKEGSPSQAGTLPSLISSVEPLVKVVLETGEGFAVRALGPAAAMTPEEKRTGIAALSVVVAKWSETAPWMLKYAAEIGAATWLFGYGSRLLILKQAKDTEKRNAGSDVRVQGVGKELPLAPGAQEAGSSPAV